MKRILAIAALLLLIGAGSSVAGVWLWASYHLRIGRAEMERYHTAEAARHLQDVLSVWPHHPETLLLTARAARRSGAFDFADRLLDLYQQQRGEDANLELERVCLRAERGEPDSVAKYCKLRIESNDPAAPLFFEALAKGYYHNYQPNKALMVLKLWLEREPDNPQALLLQGQVWDLVLHQTDAVQSYRAALTADPALDEARLRLCDDLMSLGSVPEAQPHLEYLHGRMPNNPKVQVYLARIQDRQGHAEEAERMLDAVLAEHPNFAPALIDRSILALRRGQRDAAEQWLRQAIQQDPGNLQARWQYALCLEQNGKATEAAKEREKLRQIEKDIQDIQAIASGALEQKPHNADLHYQIGMISLRAGAVEEGLRWLHSALKEDPNHQRTHQALMEHYQRVGEFGRARQHRQKLKKK